MSSTTDNQTNSEGEGADKRAAGNGDGLLHTPHWLQKSSSLAEDAKPPVGSGWRTGSAGPGAGQGSSALNPAATTGNPYSRFNSSSGPDRWREPSNGGPPKREPTRWSADPTAERWTDVVPGSRQQLQPHAGAQYAEPYIGMRPGGWQEAAAGRGRGRPEGGVEVGAAPPAWRREPGEWRGPSGDGPLVPPMQHQQRQGDWRSNERWGPNQPQDPQGVRRSDQVPAWRAGPRPADVAPPPPPVTEASGRGRGRAPASSFFRQFAPGTGTTSALASSGLSAWPAGKAWAQRRHRTEDLARIYRRLLYANRLRLPAGVERDDPLLFLAEGDYVDVLDQMVGVAPEEASRVFTEHYAALMRLPPASRPGPPPERQEAAAAAAVAQRAQQAAAAAVASGQQVAASSWVYTDPQGILQGPFSREDILDWYEQGFFPLDLQLRPAEAPAAALFVPLKDLLRAWGKALAAPPGFPAGGAPPVELPDDLLSDSLQALGVSHNHQQQAFAAARAPSDPVVDPSLVRRPSASSLLAAAAAAPPPPHMQQQQQQQQQQALHGGLPPIGLPPFAPPGPGLLGGPTGPHPGMQYHQQQQQQQQAVFAQFQSLSAGHPGQGFPPPPPPHHLGIGAGHPFPLGPMHHQLPGELPPQHVVASAPAWGGAAATAPQQQQQFALAEIQHQQAVAEQQRQLMERQRAEEDAHLAQQQRVVATAAAAEVEQQQRLAEEQRLREAEQRMREAEERQRAAEAELSRRQAEAAKSEPKPAPWMAASPAGGKSLLAIQAEEAERRAGEAAEKAAAATRAGGTTPPAQSGWARVARGGASSSGPAGMSLKDIQDEEERMKSAAAAQKHAPTAAPAEEEGLFWDYTPAPATSAPPPPPPSAPAQRGGWAAAAAAKAPPSVMATTVGNGAPPASRKPAMVGSRAAAIIAPVSQPPPPPPAPMASAAVDFLGSFAPEGSSALTGPFREWCAQQMQALTGSSDTALCEFLLTLESNSEVAEYVTEFLGKSAATATFSSEFLKRKLAEAAASERKKSRKSRAKANAAAAAAALVAAAGAAKPAAPGSSSWEMVATTTVGGKGGKKKGQKVDSQMLGFGTGTNYTLLERAE